MAHRAQLVVGPAVFSSGHAPTLAGARRRSVRDVDVERLAAHHRVHRAVEFGLRLADHVLARRPRRNVGQQQFGDAGLRGGLTRPRCRTGAASAAGRRIVRPRRLAQEHVGAAGQFDQRIAARRCRRCRPDVAPGRVGDPHARRTRSDEHTSRGSTVSAPICTDSLVDPVADVEDVGEVVDLRALRRRRRAEPRPRVLRAVHQAALWRGRRMVAPPNEQPGQVEAMVGVQVRQQDVHRVGVGVALQRAEHAASEIDDQRQGVGRGQQVPGRWRITQIKAQQLAPRIVILSMYADPENVQQARAVGADEFLVKIANFRILINAILGGMIRPIQPTYRKEREHEQEKFLGRLLEWSCADHIGLQCASCGYGQHPVLCRVLGWRHLRCLAVPSAGRNTGRWSKLSALDC